MSVASRAALLLVLSALPAAAQQQTAAPTEERKPVQVGTSIICDTQLQMERFVATYDGDAMSTARKVNREVKKSDACVVATLAYLVGDGLGTARSKAGSFNIVRVLVVGLGTPNGMQAVVPATFFSVVKIEEYDA